MAAVTEVLSFVGRVKARHVTLSVSGRVGIGGLRASAAADAVRISGSSPGAQIIVHRLVERGWRGRLDVLLLHRLTLAEAWDWQCVLAAAVSAGCEVSAFTGALGLAEVLAVGPCQRRSAPALSGPLEVSPRPEAGGVAGARFRAVVSGQLLVGTSGAAKRLPLGLGEDSETLTRPEHDIAVSAARRITEMTGVDVMAHDPICTGADALALGLLNDTPGGARYSRSEPESRRGRRWLGSLTLCLLGRQPRAAPVVVAHLRDGPVAGLTNLVRTERALLRRSAASPPAGVLLVIDVAGGGLNQADGLHGAIRRLRGQLPVECYVHRATSAGYLAACAGAHLTANPLAIVGGIGAAAMALDPQGLAAQLVDEFSPATSGIGWYPSRSKSIAQHAVQRRADVGAAIFRARLQGSRPQVAEHLAALRDGRSVGATQAAQLGLIDEIGDWRQAVAHICATSGVERLVDLGPASRLGQLTRFVRRAAIRS